jgi:hypothetical protein
MPPALRFIFYVMVLLFRTALVATPSAAAEISLTEQVSVRFIGDFIGGYFEDDALTRSAGREVQMFKMSRGLLGFEARHEGGFGGLFEYNFLADEPKRVDGNTAYNDYYKNLGTELLYYGDFKARNAYAFYEKAGRFNWRLRAGRMVNIIGFEEEEVPFWGRNDSPHAHFITKEILNGAAVRFGMSWFSLEAAFLSGRGRPDSDYNWYLNGQTDPNTKGNNTPVLEAEAILRWRDYLQLSAGWHRNKTGSAPGSLFNGKHNDNRWLAGGKLQTGRLGDFLNRITILGQLSRFEDGLTEDGTQGDNTPELSNDLRKDGWFISGGLTFFDRLTLFATYEELDRIDPLVWQKIAAFDPTHPAFDSIERSTILQAELNLNRWARLIAFYRIMDFDFKQLSEITVNGTDPGVDKAGLVLRVGF